MMEWTNEGTDFYLSVARKELLKILEKAPEDPLISSARAITSFVAEGLVLQGGVNQRGLKHLNISSIGIYFEGHINEKDE